MIRTTPRHRRSCYRLAALMLLAVLMGGCAYVPYDEAAIQGALFSKELTEIATIGPVAFEGYDDDSDGLARPQFFHPTLSIGSGGYAIRDNEYRIKVYYTDGSSSEEIGDGFADGLQLASRFEAHVVGGGSPVVGVVEPLLLTTFEGDFRRLVVYTDQGFLTEVDIVAPIDSITGVGNIIVGAYFRSIDGAQDQLTVLAREFSSATFREFTYTVTYTGALAGSFPVPTQLAAGGFPLPNLTDDVIIYNGQYVYDPVAGRSYLSVQDDRDYITYSWDPTNPGIPTESAVSGVVSHATANGTVLAYKGEELVEYDGGENKIDSYLPGSLRPIGLYWDGNSVEELYAAVGVTRGIPESSLTAQLFRR